MTASALRREFAGIGLLLAGAFLLGALLLQVPEVGARCVEARGPFGPLGSWLRCVLIGAVGLPGALLVSVGLVGTALVLFGRVTAALDGRRAALFWAGLVVLGPVAIGLALGAPPEAGDATGLVGGMAAHYLRKALGAAGAWLAWLLVFSTVTEVTLRWNPLRLVLGRANQTASAEAPRPPGGAPLLARVLEPEPGELPAVDPRLARDALAAAERGAASAAPAAASPEPTSGAAPQGAAAPVTKGRRPRERDAAPPLPAAVELEDLPAHVGESLPPTDLLTPPPRRQVEAGRRELDAAGERLLATLRTFKVDGELVGRTTGPTVTQFEIEPAAGVKVRQIAALADDLALAMRAPSIRIVAPIPGRGAVGVEVPNPTPEMVVLREVLDAAEFRGARAALPIALGKDLEGRPVVADLARMPHLLIAGATGSGKSVCVNTIITSLVYRHTPRTLRFLMVDPKMVELSVYNALPHLRHKVITDNRDAAAVLKWAVMEMQDRYRLLEANGCRNLQEFNRRAQQQEEGTGAPLLRPRSPDVAFEARTYDGGILPYLVVVIDEMADLMMTVQAEVETPIAMLAQKARAIGIHLILATQRPSVNVITGLIKANFPCRIAFRVASQVDSRTIIDGAGAESLLGNGDMLFIPPGKSEAARLQGAYLSSEETAQLLAWYGARPAVEAPAAAAASVEPDILETVRAAEAKARGDEEEPDGGGDGARDPRFREACEVVLQHRQGSTSLLQRRLKVGYGRAARLVDQLEAAGVLSPSEGPSRPREVLIGAEDLDRVCGD